MGCYFSTSIKFSGNQTGLSSVPYLSATCLINVVYLLASRLLISVVKAVVSGALFCCLSLLSSGNLVAKTARCQFIGL